MSIADKLTAVAENMSKVYEAGKKSEYDTFWDSYQSNGTRTSYLNGFSGYGWNIDTFKPKYDIKPVVGYMMFRDFNGLGDEPIDMVELFEKQGVIFDTSKTTNMTYIFQNARISRLGKISLASTSAYENPFINCARLVTIEELNFGTTGKQLWYNVFTGCIRLANLNSVKGIIGQNASFSDCPLTAQSIKNVVNVLSNTTTGKSLTLNKAAVQTAFGIIEIANEEEWQVDGNEYYELIKTKPNWTFSHI